MSNADDDSCTAPATRDELVAMVARAHKGSAYAEAVLAGRTLAAQSKLPRPVAENLGAGFGQWDFFPEPEAIVDFALAYVPPATPEDLWTLARAWASDEAAGRPTLTALLGRDLLHYELRRIDVPELRRLIDETRPAQARALRASLGLPVAAARAAKAEREPKPAAAPARAPTAPSAIPARMPKPELRRPVKPEPPPPAKRFRHPKFGEGVLELQVGEGPDAKLTIKFETGSKTLLARYVTEAPA